MQQRVHNIINHKAPSIHVGGALFVCFSRVKNRSMFACNRYQASCDGYARTNDSAAFISAHVHQSWQLVRRSVDAFCASIEPNAGACACTRRKPRQRTSAGVWTCLLTDAVTCGKTVNHNMSCIKYDNF